ncbi:MAG: helix-turn-helix domain-containing protein [Oscillospiraceae bacterium]
MSREDYLKKKIVEKGKNQKAVAADLQIPYSTLRDMLTNVGSARVDNVIKLCRYLGITVSELDCAEIDNPKKDDFIIDDHEKDIIRAYRKQSPTVKAAIDRMLEIESPAEEKQAKKIG